MKISCYDAENRLTTMATAAVPNATTYAYDGSGHRIMKTIGSATTVYVYGNPGQYTQTPLDENLQGKPGQEGKPGRETGGKPGQWGKPGQYTQTQFIENRTPAFALPYRCRESHGSPSLG